MGAQFWAEQVGTKEARMTVQELEEYYEVARKVFESFPPEKRLEGLTPRGGGAVLRRPRRSLAVGAPCRRGDRRPRSCRRFVGPPRAPDPDDLEARFRALEEADGGSGRP
jgi:hypothetical protein